MSDDKLKLPDEATRTTRKCLRMELTSGAAVAGYALDGGGFEWVFTSKESIITRLRLSKDATYAICMLAEGLLDPTGKESA